MANLTVNGVNLQHYAWNIQTRGSRFNIPKRRGSNTSMPGAHGARRVPGKPFEARSLILTMWAVGCNPDGSVPVGGAQRTVEQNIDTLGRLFTATPEVSLVQTREDGTTRTLVGAVEQAIDFTTMAGASRAEFAVEITASDPFWYDVNTTTQTVMTPSAGTYPFLSFANTTAPLVKATYTLKGPATSPVLTNPVTGQWVKYAGTLAQGALWVVNTQTWTSTANGTNVIAQTTHGDGVTFLELSPHVAGPQVALSGTGFSAVSSLQIVARKAYLSA